MFISVAYLGVHKVEKAYELNNMLRHNQIQQKRKETKDKMNKLVSGEISFQEVLHNKTNN